MPSLTRTDQSQTVHHALRDTCSRIPRATFLEVLPETAQRYGIEPRSYTYLETWREVDRLATIYRLAGLAVGHRVALMLESRPEFFFHWFALNALGASVVPLSAEWRSSELEYLLGHAEPVLAVVPEMRRDDIATAAKQAGRRLNVTGPDLSALERVRVAGCPPRAETANSTECALLYTSGTTGKPKGCVLTNQYFLEAGRWYASLSGLCNVRPNAERLLSPLPTSHMNAMAFSSLVMVLTGGCLIPLDRFRPRSWWSNVRESNATIVHYLGVMPAMLMNAPEVPQDREHCIRFGFGAGVPPRLHAKFEARFGFPLVEAWAMTETGAGAAIIANHEPRAVGTACFGRPTREVEHRVVDDHDQPVVPGEPGELLVRAAGGDPRKGFFAEYLKDPEATALAWAGGYFHTGDVVSVDVEGRFHFIDRKKNVIRRSGENISAVEVESVLLQHPDVRSVGVAAVPDPIRGDEVMACVVPRQMPMTLQECESLSHALFDHCSKRLAYFKAPGYVAFCDELPLTPTEKIQRAALVLMARDLHAEGHCVDLRELKRRRTHA